MVITNKKILEEMQTQAQDNNTLLREQLKEQLTEIREVNQNFAMNLSEEYKTGICSISEQLQEINKKQEDITNQKTAELYNKITQTLSEEIFKNSRLEMQKLTQMEEKFIQEFAQLVETEKILSSNIESLQKDTAIIMETLQLILTNMLLDDVRTKQRHKK